MAKFQKGHKKKGGRKKGSGNKFTGLKDAFIEAFRNIDAAQGLVKWIRKSNDNQKVFYTLIARMLPAEMKAQVEGKETLTFNILSAVPRPTSEPKIKPKKKAKKAQDPGPARTPADMTDAELEREIRRLRKEERKKHAHTREAA